MPVPSVPVVISTTVERRTDAEKISRILLEKRLIACAQIQGPISSSYWWQGAIVTAQEFLLTIKSVERLAPQIEDLILSIHPYSTPEIIMIPISRISDDYRQWLEKELVI